VDLNWSEDYSIAGLGAASGVAVLSGFASSAMTVMAMRQVEKEVSTHVTRYGEIKLSKSGAQVSSNPMLRSQKATAWMKNDGNLVLGGPTGVTVQSIFGGVKVNAPLGMVDVKCTMFNANQNLTVMK
jgi:hypothetical protein